jgi:hypothetical protein
MNVDRCFIGVASALVGVLWSFSVHGLVVKIDTFTVTKNTAALSDGFADGSAPPSGPLAPNPPDYFLQGTFPGGAESGGKLTLDTAHGGLTVNALGEARRTQGATLLTSTGNPSQALWVTDDISVSALFDLVVPVGPLFNTYGIQIIDATATQPTQQLLQLFVAFNPAVGLPLVSYINQDFVTNTILSFGAAELTPPAEAEQIFLQLTRLRDDETDELTNSFQASFAFLDSDGDSIESSTFSNLGVMFDGEDFVRGRFFAAVAVPEPGTLALLLGAVAGFALLRRRRIASS